MSAAAVVKINSPDARWPQQKAVDKLAIKRGVRDDPMVSNAEFRSYDLIFERAWVRRRVRLTQDEWSQLSGDLPLSTWKWRVKGLREKGHLAARRFSHVLELIVAPTAAELEADPVWCAARSRPAPYRKPRIRGKDGRFIGRAEAETAIFVAQGDSQRVDEQTVHPLAITSPQVADSKDQKNASSSIYKKPEIRKTSVVGGPVDDGRSRTLRVDGPAVAPLPEATTQLESSKTKPLSVEEQKPKPKSPRQGFVLAFERRFAKQFPNDVLSEKDMQQIENWLARHGVGWDEFTRRSEQWWKGSSTKNPVGLVKGFARDWALRTRPANVVTLPPREAFVEAVATRERPEDWQKRCEACKRTGLLPDGTPCPQCQLGKDLAVQRRSDAKRQARESQPVVSG